VNLEEKIEDNDHNGPKFTHISHISSMHDTRDDKTSIDTKDKLIYKSEGCPYKPKMTQFESQGSLLYAPIFIFCLYIYIFFYQYEKDASLIPCTTRCSHHITS
jgi:hypothetical protein